MANVHCLLKLTCDQTQTGHGEMWKIAKTAVRYTNLLLVFIPD